MMNRAPIRASYLLLFLWVVGCQSTPSLQSTIQEGSSGKVYLKTVAQEAFQASHPVSLPLPTLHGILAGVHIREQRQLFQKLLSGNAEAIPVFSERDIAFLAKGLQRGLRQASPQEVVGFLLFHEAQSASEATEGTVYHHNASLHLTLRKIPSHLDKSQKLSPPKKQRQDTNGLRGKELSFSPEGALRPSSHSSQLQQPFHGKTIVINYSSLEGHQTGNIQPHDDPSPGEGPKDPSLLHDLGETIDGDVPLPQDPETLEGVVIQQQQEILDLRKELKDIQLDLQELQEPPPPSR